MTKEDLVQVIVNALDLAILLAGALVITLTLALYLVYREER
ncbi:MULTISPECIES: hypothetical protein [Thermus]|nr:hypothetical protein [Thermus brockianus]